MGSASKLGDGGIAGAQAVRRAMDVIRAVAAFQRSGANLSRVSQVTGLNSSTTFRILRSLTEERMLRYEQQERNYYLGMLAFELGLATQGELQVQNKWRDAVEIVSQRTRLTAYLMTRSDSEAICLLCSQGSMQIRAMPMDVGQRVPLGVGAGSLAILSNLEDAEVTRILESQKLRLALTPRGGEEAQLIIQRVAETRANGFSVSAGSLAVGVAGVGVAFQPRDSRLQLAISVSAVTDSIEPSEARRIADTIASAIQMYR